MKVLLIDGVGHVREYDIPYLMDTILVPLERPMSAVWTEDEASAPVRFPVARFEYSPEPSWPPVYRQRSFPY